MKRIKKVRLVFQMECTECGAASLAMILAYYGRFVTLEELRRDCSVSRNGVNARNIALAAQLHGLEVNPVRVEAENAESLALPAIIHWDMNHFLVLCGFNKKGVVLADPADGMRTVSRKEFAESFTGVALELAPGKSFKKRERPSGTEGYIWSYVKGFSKASLCLVFLEFAMAIGTLSTLFLNSLFIDEVLISGSQKSLKIILGVLLCSGMLVTVSMGVSLFFKKYIGEVLNIEINTGFIEHILKLPIEFFKNRNEGDITSRQGAVMQIGRSYVNLLFPLPATLMQIIVYLVLIIVFDVKVAVFAIVTAIMNLILIVVMNKKNSSRLKLFGRDVGKLHGEISSIIDKIETIKSCGVEYGAFMRLISGSTRISNERVVIDSEQNEYENMLYYLNDFCSGLILITGIVRIFNGDLTTGILIASQAMVAELMKPVGNLAGSGQSIERFKSDSERADDVMNYHIEDRFLSEDERQEAKITGTVEMKDVCFRYNPFDEYSVDSFSMRVEKGCSVALTGPSGSGKSTVAKLIAGIYTPQKGDILFDGSQFSEIKHSDFYSKVSMVNQTAYMFDGTVAENISMWDKSISYDEIKSAAKAACIHDDIIRRKDGYNEKMTGRGSNFSGGQRQRIELARAIIKKPLILILDEATSNLDTLTERKVISNIKALGITCIIVAHRLSTIRDCDEIILLENGVIRERGTHEELIKKKGKYCRLEGMAEDG